MIYSSIFIIILYLNFVSLTRVEDSSKYQGKIALGNNVTKVGSYSYYLSLQSRPVSTGRPNYCDINVKYMHICGGALVGTRIMITAAHCLLNDTLIRTYRILPNYQNKPIVDGKDETYKILKYRVHPNFTLDVAPFSAYDIAIVILDANVSRKHKLLKLPDLPLNPNTKVKMMSFGANSSNAFPSIMQEASLLTRSDDKCLDELTWASFSRDVNVCVSNDQGSTGCPSDSGAPLVWEDPDSSETYLVGVLSNGLCHRSKYTVFVHIHAHLKFINDAVRELVGGVSY